MSEIKDAIYDIQTLGLKKAVFEKPIYDISSIKQYNSLLKEEVPLEDAKKAAIKDTNAATRALITSSDGAIEVTEELTTASKASTIAAKAQSVAYKAVSVAANMLAMALITKGIELAANAIDHWVNKAKYAAEAMEEAESKVKDAQSTLQNVSSTISENKDRFLELSEGVDKFSNNVSLSADDYNEYLSICNKLADIAPELITGYDDQGNALLQIGSNAEETSDKLQQVIEDQQTATQKTLIENIGNIADGVYSEVQTAKDEINSLNAELEDTKYNAKDINIDIAGSKGQITFSDKDYGTYGKQMEKALTDAGIEFSKQNGLYDTSIQLKSATKEQLAEAQKFYDSWLKQQNTDNKIAKNQLEESITAQEQSIKESYNKMSQYLQAWAKDNAYYKYLGEQGNGYTDIVDKLIPQIDWSSMGDKAPVNDYEYEQYIEDNIIKPLMSVPEKHKSEIQEMFNKLLSFEDGDVNIVPFAEKLQKKLDGYGIKIDITPIIADEKIGWEKYQKTLDRFTKLGDSQKIKDFFDTEGIDTDKEIDEFNKITKGIDDADLAIQTWNEHIKDSTGDAQTFSDTLNSADYADIKEKLLELAKSGEITPETLSSTKEYNELLEKTGVSAEDAKDQILDMLSAQERLSGATQGLEKLKSAYEEFKDKDIGFVTAETLESLPDVFKNLPEFDLFSKIAGNPESGKEKIQQAFNDIVKAYILDQETLQGLVDADTNTIQTYIANLKQMGITNAEEVVRTASEVLNSDNKMIDDAEKEYNKYLKNKLKGGEEFLKSTASQNSALKKALGSTYQSDYDNWCDLLSKKADAYNKFVDAIGGSYDDSKSVIQNMMDNGENISANSLTDAYTALAEYNKQVKEYKKLKDSLKLDLSPVTTNFKTNYSPSTSSSKKSKSKAKSDTSEVFDFIATYLDKVTDKASKAKDKIDELLSFDGKKNQTKKAIEATTKAIKAQETAYKRYINYANKQATKENNKKTSSSSSSSTTTSKGGQSVYDTATNYLGLKYVWGGSSLTSGADCSGFVQQIYKKYGVDLPHHAASQAKMGTKITSKSDLQAGDLVFFGSKNNITHVGIYGGDGKFIESPHTGASVRISKLSSRKDFVSGSRFNQVSGTTATTDGKNVKSVKGVSSKTLEHYKKLIREGTLDSDGIATIKNEKLKNALQSYQTYYEKAKACKEQVESLKEQLKELYETLANNPIDKAADKIEKLGTKMDLLNSKISNLTFDPSKKIKTSSITKLGNQVVKNYDSQLSASKEEYTSAKSSYSSSKKTLTKKFNGTSASKLGLTKAELTTVKNNLKNNKKIPTGVINKIYKKFGYCSLYEKCIAHNEYLEAYRTATTEYNQAKEDHTSNVRQARKDTFDKIQGVYDNKSALIEQKNTAISNALSIAEAKGEQIGEGYYTLQIKNTNDDLASKYEEVKKLKKQLATIDFGSDEWYEAQDSLAGVYQAIQQDTQSLAEFQNEINQLKFDRFDELINKLGDITDETDFLIDMLDSDNLFNSDTGMITDDGITAIGLTAQNYDTYLAEAEKYKEAIADLNEMYNKGEIGLSEYTTQLRTYQQGQRDSIKSANEAKKSVIAYVKQGLDAQNEALSEAISKKKELLETEKDLKEFQDKIADQNKNIAKLQKQIAALEGDDSEENRKKLQQLKSDLQDAQKEQSDTFYDRSISDQEDALDKMLENSKKQAEDYLKDSNKVFTDALGYVNSNTYQVSQNIEKIAKDTGYDVSQYIVNAWEDGGNAVGIYTNVLSSTVPNITTQLGLIAGQWEAICKAANDAAEASAKYYELQITNTQNNGTDGWNSNISDIANNTTIHKNNTDKTSNTESQVRDFIAKNIQKASQKKEKYGSLNKYIYGLTGGYILSKTNEVQLAKLLKVNVKNDLSGKNDRDNILKALKEIGYGSTVKKSSFSKGGIVDGLVKMSGEDGISFLKRGEAVLTQEQVKAMLKLAPVVPQMNTMMDNLKNISSLSNVKTSVSEPHIEINTTVEGVATDKIVKDFENVATRQAENVIKKINNTAYAKGVRFR